MTAPVQLFQQEPSHVPAVAASSGSQQPAPSPSGGYTQQAPESPGAESLNTLDEPVWHTIKRDLIRIYGNLVLVVFPFKNRDQQTAALRNWDLWGPMVCCPEILIFLAVWFGRFSVVDTCHALMCRFSPSHWQYVCQLTLRSPAAFFQ